MDWLRRWFGRGPRAGPEEPTAARAEARREVREEREPRPEDVGDELDEAAHRRRTEEFFREPRKPPGAG